jgi:hypothetical protein
LPNKSGRGKVWNEERRVSRGKGLEKKKGECQEAKDRMKKGEYLEEKDGMKKWESKCESKELRKESTKRRGCKEKLE